MATSTITRKKLSSATNGKGILIAATATLGTALHTVSANIDEVYIWVVNSSAADVDVTIEMAGVTSPKDVIVRTIPAKTKLLVVDGITLFSSVGNITAFAGSANVLSAFGHVNEIT